MSKTSSLTISCPSGMVCSPSIRKLISDANLYIAFALMGAAVLVGPKLEMINSFTNALGSYLNSFVQNSLGSLVWFAIFGTLGIHTGQTGALSAETLKPVAASPETGLFVVMEQYPFATVLCIVALVLLCTFFITSANSGTFVLSMLTSDGALNLPNSKKVLWGVVQSVMAVGLLIAGGLKPLQVISIAAAFPFIFIMVATCVALVKVLKEEKV